jgi:hypothetical protein
MNKKKKSELIKKLEELYTYADFDQEKAHIQADQALLDYIDDPDIGNLFHEIPKWYS